MLYNASGWTLIVNHGTGQWGTDYDAKGDLGRVRLTSRTMAEPEETLTFTVGGDRALDAFYHPFAHLPTAPLDR